MGSSQTLSINSCCSSFVLSRQEYQPYLPNNLPQDSHNGLQNSLWDNHPRLCMWVCMYHQLPSSETGSCFLCRKLDKVQFGRTHVCVRVYVCVLVLSFPWSTTERNPILIWSEHTRRSRVVGRYRYLHPSPVSSASQWCDWDPVLAATSNFRFSAFYCWSLLLDHLSTWEKKLVFRFDGR